MKRKDAKINIAKAQGYAYFFSERYTYSDSRRTCGKLLGDPLLFDHCISVDWEGKTIDSREIGWLNDLNEMDVLNLSESTIANNQFEFLANMDNLRILHLNKSNVLDEDLENLSGSSGMEILWLSDTMLTDLAVINTVSKLKRIELLSLGPHVTKKCLKELALLPKLRQLWLHVSGDVFTWDDVMCIENMNQLKTLSISGGKFSEKPIKRMRRARSDVEFTFE